MFEFFSNLGVARVASRRFVSPSLTVFVSEQGIRGMQAASEIEVRTRVMAPLTQKQH